MKQELIAFVENSKKQGGFYASVPNGANSGIRTNGEKYILVDTFGGLTKETIENKMQGVPMKMELVFEPTKDQSEVQLPSWTGTLEELLAAF